MKKVPGNYGGNAANAEHQTATAVFKEQKRTKVNSSKTSCKKGHFHFRKTTRKAKKPKVMDPRPDLT